MLLVLVAELGEAQEPDLGAVDALGLELAARALFRFGEQFLDRRSGVAAQVGEAGDEIVAAQVRHHHAPGREHRRPGGNDDLLHAEFLRERDGMHRTAAAEGDEREVARIEAAVERHQLQRVDHVVVGDADDAARRFGRIDAELGSDGLDCRACRAHVGIDRAAAEIVLVDPPEPQIGVGRRRIGPALAVGRRPRQRTGRLRADMQLAEIVDPGDRAAAIADLDQVDHRNHDRIAGRRAVALDPVVGHDLDLAVLDQRALSRRAADVECKHIGLSDQLAELGRAPEARGGTGFHHGDGNARYRLQRVDAAIGLHDVERAAETAAIEPVGKTPQVALRDRLDVGGQDRCVGALVFAPLARDLV